MTGWDGGGLTVCGKIRDAADGVALDLNVGAEHLADERLDATERDDQELVLGWVVSTT